MGKKITFAMLQREKRKLYKKWVNSEEGKKAIESFKKRIADAAQKSKKDKK